MYNEDPKIILDRMKGNVPNELNKSEGSIIHDTLVGTSEELGFAYSILNTVINRVFGQRALENGYSEELELTCNGLGIYRKQGLYATGTILVSAATGTIIPKNTIVQTQSGLKFKITDEDTTITLSGSATLNIQAIDIGSLYNVEANTIIELENQIPGVISLTNVTKLTNGVNRETDQEIWDRYLFKINTPATSGNVGHYKQWALEVSGVGDAHVIPTWNGGGTVKVILLDSTKRSPSQEIINLVKDHIEAERPVGPTITVVGATEVVININATVQLAADSTLEQVTSDIEGGIKNYLEGLAFKDSLVRYTKIASILLDIPYIIDYFGLTVNAASINVEIPEGSVAVLGTVNIIAA